jgi:hypothetical protein
VTSIIRPLSIVSPPSDEGATNGFWVQPVMPFIAEAILSVRVIQLPSHFVSNLIHLLAFQILFTSELGTYSCFLPRLSRLWDPFNIYWEVECVSSYGNLILSIKVKC